MLTTCRAATAMTNTLYRGAKTLSEASGWLSFFVAGGPRLFGEGDVHDGRAGCARRGDALQAGAEARAELPGDIRGEGGEDAALLLRLDRGELVEGEAWVSTKFDRYV